jgi:hypothetical protein
MVTVSKRGLFLYAPFRLLPVYFLPSPSSALPAKTSSAAGLLFHHPSLPLSLTPSHMCPPPLPSISPIGSPQQEGRASKAADVDGSFRMTAAREDLEELLEAELYLPCYEGQLQPDMERSLWINPGGEWVRGGRVGRWVGRLGSPEVCTMTLGIEEVAGSLAQSPLHRPLHGAEP